MFEAVRTNRRIVQVILGLIVLTFAFFGIESYLQGIGNDRSLATVGDTKIGPGEFENALRRQQDQIRARAGGEVDPALLNTPAIREAVLEGLVNQRLLAIYAADARLSVPLAQLQEVIGSIDEFKQDGQFSRARYEQVLRSQGLTESAFEAQLRRDVAFRQLTTAIGSSAIVPRKSALEVLKLQLEERSVAIAKLPIADLVSEVAVSDDEVKRYYEGNPSRFRTIARLKAEYVVLDRAEFAKSIKVSSDDVRKWYDEHQDRYRQDEERRARHILIELPADAPEAAVTAAQSKAQSILAGLRTSGGQDFESVARKESQDPGSADKGGDLGYFTRGSMVKPFEDAVFAMKEGEISDVVRSDFGLHIIQLTGVRPEKLKPIDEVAPAIEAELREQEAQRKFAEAAEAFSNVVYEQPDSLQPAADQFGLKVQSTEWIAKSDDAAAPFDNRKLHDAVFASDAVERKLNTEAVDLGDGRLVSARVVTYEAERTRALEDVRNEIVAELKKEGASKLAADKGGKLLAALQSSDPAAVTFDAATKLDRRSTSLDEGIMRRIFAAASDKLPVYGGATAANGDFVIFRIEAVHVAEVGDDDPRLGNLRAQYERLIAERDLQAFLAELRRKYGVEINRAAMQAVAS